MKNKQTHRFWDINSNSDRVIALQQAINDTKVIIADLYKKRSKRKMKKNALIINQLQQLQKIRAIRIEKIQGVTLDDLADGVELSTFIKIDGTIHKETSDAEKGIGFGDTLYIGGV